MPNLFNPHPYSTQVGTLTERATDSGQTSEDWSLILEICDTINETDEGPKEAVRAIRKRITSSAGKDHIAIWYTLILLEACIKNCGRRFHSQIANKEFLHDFLKLLSPKNEPSQQMQIKVLSMIKAWVDCGWDVPGRRDLEKVYTSLRQRGIQFPPHPVSNEVFRHRTNSSETINMRSTSASFASPKGHFQAREPGKHSSTNMISIPRSTVDLRLESNSQNATQLCHTCRTYHSRTMNSVVSPVSGICQPHSSTLPVQSSTVPSHAQSVHRNRPVVNSVRSNGSVNTEQQIVPSYRSDTSHARQAPVYERRHNGSFPAHIPVERMEFDLDGTVRHLTSSQRIRLTQDLAVVETNVNVLNDMLAELRPDTVSPDDLNLLQELYQTCRAMHRRVVEFLSQVSDEEATPCLLQVNDNLNNAFSRYERFERYRIRALRSEMMYEAAALDLASVRFGSINAAHSNSTLRLTARPHNAPGPMLAITAGRSTTMNSRTTGTTRHRASNNNNHVVPDETNSVNCQLTNGNQVRPHINDDDADDDDDDSLIDISSPPTQSHARRSIETDDIEQWLVNRQMVPVSQSNPTRNPISERSPGTRLAFDQNTEALNALALVPTTQALQTRPTASQLQCAVRKPASQSANPGRRTNPFHSGDLVQF